MKFCAALFAVVAACVAVAASPQANDWGDLAIVSGTLGNNANRLCLGVPASMRPSDFGCPSYAPYVSATSGFMGIGTVTPNAPLQVTSNLPGAASFPLMLYNSHNDTNTGVGLQFVTNSSLHIGSNIYLNRDVTAGPRHSLRFSVFGAPNTGANALTIRDNGNVGISTTTPTTKLEVYGTISATNLLINGQAVGSQADRITSGTSNVIANEDRSVTISTAGSTRVTVGENGNVGIGIAYPSVQLHISNSAVWDEFARFSRTAVNYLSVANYGTVGQAINVAQGALYLRAANSCATCDVALQPGGFAIPILTAKANTGYVGIGTTTPAATLHVSGSLIVSTSAQTTNPSLYVGTNGNVGIGTITSDTLLTLGSGTNQDLLKFNTERAWKFATAGTGGSTDLILASLNDGKSFGIANSFNVKQFNFFTKNGSAPTFSTAGGARIGTLDTTGAIPTGNLIVDQKIGIGTTAPSATLTVSGSAIVSGTVQVAGTGNEACTAGTLGTIRFNPVTGAPQICVQR